MSNKGKIYLVGFGPGAKSQMTLRALEAIEEADVVIGYSTYIKLVKDLLEGKEVIKKGMTEELDRAVEAYSKAKEGKKVALISSGDIGVYGMAGPAYEVLLQSGWKPGGHIEVELIPGTTALSACSSLVGAPLTHDFCSISLSDLLTPWPVIAGRLEAAGKADFVVALYNPKSGRRTEQIEEAAKILLRYRDPKTPVALVKSAYRERQNIQMSTLDKMVDEEIGMLTTVLIGNSSTTLQENLMITPRGYGNKYEALTGDAKEGEKAGISLSMGLEGWPACVRRHLREEKAGMVEKVAKKFGLPLVKILEAISEEEEQSPYRAAFVNQEKWEELLQAIKEWGTLRAIVRAPEGGAVTETFVTGAGFKLKGEWLNFENDHFHLHVNWGKVQKAAFYQKEGKTYGLFFLDIEGNSVFKLLLKKEGETFNSTQLESFNAHWQRFSPSAEVEREALSV